MVPLIASVLSLLATLAPLLVEHIQKRLHGGTLLDAAAAARDAEIATLPAAIARLESSGDLASADVFRRRLRDLTAPERGDNPAG
jgi:hypothetical protein